MKKLFKKVIKSTLAIFAVAMIVLPGQANALVPKPAPEPERTHTVHRYWNSRKGYHYYTTNYNELNNDTKDFKYEGALGKIIRKEHKDYYEERLKPVYRYKLEGEPNYRYSTSKIHNNDFEYIDLVGYVSSHRSQTFSVEIFEYRNTNDYFYTNNWKELGEGGYGWKFIKTLGFMAPADSISTPAPTPNESNEDIKKCKTCIYRYWNGHLGRHRYTFNYYILKDGKKDYRFEGVLGQFETAKYYRENQGNTDSFAPQLTKLYFYTNRKTNSYKFSTQKLNEKGWSRDFSTRYISTYQTDRYNVPMYEFVNGEDYLYTSNPNEVKTGSGWGEKKLIGFLRAFPAR